MLRILIADDDLIARLLLSEHLSELGVCDAVVDGTEVVRAYRLAIQRGKPYDLICLDIMMPNMNGLEALSKIREIENSWSPEMQVPIIMVSALADELTNKSARISKCNAYLTKPIEHEELFNKLKVLNLN